MSDKFIPDLLASKTKVNLNILPFLSFPITTSCPFKCLYCGVGGEATASYTRLASYDDIVSKVQVGYNYGVRKFRLTGGEPTVHPDFEKMAEYISGLDESILLLVNTNGSQIVAKREWLRKSRKNIRFAVSLDTLNTEKFDRLSDSKGHFEKVLQGIHLLSETGNLHRLNMVVNVHNKEDVFAIIDFCQQLKCNLKLLEVCSVPLQFNNWEELYVSLYDLEQQIAVLATQVRPHEYSRGFGIPMPIYQVGDINITVKSSQHGAHYDKAGICKTCAYFPCHEGLYDLYVIPDGRLCGCRWSANSVAIGDGFYEQLVYLAQAFQNSEWMKRDDIKPMDPNPSFVLR
jgi:molybdenum cofactor biosynthesis enzyme MoaA